jgi:3-oxoacyl-[acyl-carrier-protein] synthase-3
MKTDRSAVIVGTGLYAPEKVIDNHFFSEKFGRDMDSFLREQRNIRERHFMSDEQATSDLILPAAQKALSAAGLSAKDLDLIIVSTDTPDYISPSTASVVQFKLGATRAGTFDLNTACAGFVTALDVASKYLQADARYKNILVVGAYGMSKHFDWSDYKTVSVFADGAGAAVVQARSEGPYGVLASELYTDGQYFDSMGIYAGGTRTPTTLAAIEKHQHQLQFLKRVPPETNGLHWPRLIKNVLERAGAQVADVDHFFLTQLNIGGINEVMDGLGVARDKSHNIMDRFGYTGSACLPMALADAAAHHKLKKDDLLVFVGSGGGMSMAALVLRWSYDT